MNRMWSPMVALLMLIYAPGYAQKAKSGANGKRPKLVVGIVVDQMRWDFLHRFQDRYGKDGFMRLLKEGFSADNTHIDYVPTVTAIGHTSVYTGSVPSLHGITGNTFIVEKTGETKYCSGDDEVRTVGSDSKAGRMSPKNMLVTTIADELKLATNFRSKVIGIALKDRASILPAGHTADAAYWFDGETGRWVSSTWYMKELPQWVSNINQTDLVSKYLSKQWNTLYPIDTYLQSTKDHNTYEGKYKGTDAAVFPVDLDKLYKDNGPDIIRNTPLGNTMTLDMARAAIENEKMGSSGHTDFLTISFSATDHIGHQFGPNSIEIEDTYLRLDRELGTFFKYLDMKLGKGAYTVFLTADHGVAHNVGFMNDHKMNAGGWNMNGTLKSLNDFLASKFKIQNLALSLLYFQVHFNNQLIAAKKIDQDEVKKAAIEFLKNVEGVAYVVDMEKAASAPVPAILRERIVNGYNHERSGTVQIILKPAWVYSDGEARPTGADHSSWNPHDAHIPLVFMGWGIKPGKTSRMVNMTDIAATVASILSIQQPNGCIGNPITEALK